MKLSHIAMTWLLLGIGCAPQPDSGDGMLVVSVPAEMENSARAVADTLFTFHGAPVDSIAYMEGERLRVTLHRGTYHAPVWFADGQCAGGDVPAPALYRLGAAAYRVLGMPGSVSVVEIAHSGHEMTVASLLGSRSCGGVSGTMYYRPGAAHPW